MKVKIVELAGKELNPDARYMFVFNNYTITMEDMIAAANQLKYVLGHDKFLVVRTKGTPDEAVKVFEVPKQ